MPAAPYASTRSRCSSSRRVVDLGALRGELPVLAFQVGHQRVDGLLLPVVLPLGPGDLGQLAGLVAGELVEVGQLVGEVLR